MGRAQRTIGFSELKILLPGGKQYSIRCDVLDQVVGDLATTRLPASFLDKFKGFDLADPHFHTASHIDVLIGVVHFPYLVLPERERIEDLWLLNSLNQSSAGLLRVALPSTKRENDRLSPVLDSQRPLSSSDTAGSTITSTQSCQHWSVSRLITL